MAQMVFINFPVKDLPASTAFFTELGFEKSAQFSDENASSLMISDTIVVILLTKPYFKGFITKDIADSTTTTETTIALSRDSREAVDELVEKALAAGGQVANEPQDHGFMYGRSFYDLDGHQWEAVWMDPAQMEG